MLLDLYITHYDEPWEVCRPGFELLKNQRCVDWSNVRVTVVHDGTGPFVQAVFEDYPFTVRQVRIPHRGIAGARNWCLDDARADWIKWNDCDDLFTSAYSLKALMDGLEQAGADFDLMWFDVYAEMKARRYLKGERDPVVLHGKALRRAFLAEHGIRFNEDLTWCEDSAFLSLVEMEIDAARIGRIVADAPIYTWVYRPGSLCNRPEIRFDNLKSFFRRHCYVAEEFLRRGRTDEYNTMVARIACDSYYTLEVAGVTEDTSAHERAVWDYLRARRAALLQVRRSAFDQVIAATNRENEDCAITRAEVLAWLKALRTKYENGGMTNG
jgi:glycosyltransferase involved in cell wall biosynthesis